MITINPKQISKYIHWVNDIIIKHALDKTRQYDDALSYQTPKFRKPVPAPPPVAKPKEKENNTMYGLKLYITLDDLNTYIHNNIDGAYKNHTFIPVKSEFNEHSMDVEITLLSANPLDTDELRYKLDPNRLCTAPKQDITPCKECVNDQWDMPQCKECNAENNFKYFARW